MDCAKNTYRLFKILVIANSMVLCLIFTCPGFIYLASGELNTIYHHQIMGISVSTPIGYILTNIIHMIAGVVHGHCFTYFDGLYGVFVFNVWIFSGLIAYQIQQLNEIIDSTPAAEDSLCIKITFRNIIRMHYEMIE